MLAKYFTLLVLCTFLFGDASGQKKNTDSLKVASAFNELISICRSVDFADPKVIKLGAFYKAAPFIVYRGGDKKRAWKDFADYSNAAEKKGVDEICTRINETVNRDSSFKIVKFAVEKESEGSWYILVVNYHKKEVMKKAAFAFLKIRNRFGLGDID